MTRSVDDVHSFKGQIDNFKIRLQNAVKTYNGEPYEGPQIKAVTPENKILIDKFLMKLRREDKAIGTIITHCNCITRFAQLLLEVGYAGNLVDVDPDTFDLFLMHVEDSGVKANTIRTYKKSIKKFFSAMVDEPPKWVTQMKLKSVSSPVQPSDLLTKEELAELLDACRKPRDKAFIAILADGGLRFGALASCRIKSVTFGQYGAILFLSKTSRSNKTTPAKGIPLTWSTGYLNQWLSVHPLKNDPEAPLWVSNDKNAQAMSYKSLRELIIRVGERTNIKKRINPHSFRHLAITSWILDDLSEQEIKHRAGWSKDTRMFSTYANFSDEQINNGIYEKYGLKKENNRIVTLKTCPRCNNILKDDPNFCPQCSLSLNQDAKAEDNTFLKIAEEWIIDNPHLFTDILKKKLKR